ncbi:MAG: substrate-binding domain-containing protein [Anaerolineales bacterium]|nr:substrate-binding domain-containing protein [Anaerolineales bacterium]
MSLALFGCTPSAAPTPSPDPTAKPLTIALVMKTLTNPFFVEMERGARQAEKEFGIRLVVKTAAQETSIEQQIKIVDDLIVAGVDAIVISPGDSQKLIPVLKKAQDAGILVINIDNQLDPETAETIGLKNVPFISVDNEQGAYLSAQELIKGITTPTKVAILEGIRSAKNAQQRKAGAERAFKEHPNITIAASETANWKIDEAYMVIKAMFEKDADIAAVFCSNDVMAFGVIEYLQEIKRTDVRVVGFDALDEAKAAIRAGTLIATIDQQAAKQGYMGIEYAVKGLKGDPLSGTILVDVLVVTAETLK